MGNMDPTNNFWKEVRGKLCPWKFLKPFFAARGYTLYQSNPLSILDFYPAPTSGTAKPSCEPQFPYARRVYREDRDIVFFFGSTRVWAARDTQGRDVIIRLISGRVPSDELKVFQRLGTPEIRADPRNHSIHALDYINFDVLVFVVMHRWNEAINHDFHNVREIMHFTEAVLEGVDFWHEHRIAHCDLLEPNTDLNVLATMRADCLEGLLLEDVTVTKFLHFGLRGHPTPPGPYNPFHFDILCLGVMLQRWVRHIEDVVPNIGPFFESMVTDDIIKRFTARQALNNFRDIYSRLSLSQLDSLVTGRQWLDGHIKTKLDLPTRLWTSAPGST
ncbi:hypothetical protein BDQ12DRAFT_738577 [Crucibulum laeve]|uniref:Protein kinase domain-containing protein n=1 Tax=Crucibulum laeve TaxID=68775 RepID=A0A5C3LM49_9AGAR|nr:hypothetical protein BDQ12DRAFT_738577 [Crucibulum laeve]